MSALKVGLEDSDGSADRLGVSDGFSLPDVGANETDGVWDGIVIDSLYSSKVVVVYYCRHDRFLK